MAQSYFFGNPEEELKRTDKECGFQNVAEFARFSLKFQYK